MQYMFEKEDEKSPSCSTTFAKEIQQTYVESALEICQTLSWKLSEKFCNALVFASLQQAFGTNTGFTHRQYILVYSIYIELSILTVERWVGE